MGAYSAGFLNHISHVQNGPPGRGLPIVVGPKGGNIHRINIVAHGLVQILIGQQTVLLVEGMTSDSENLVERRELVCADILRKGQRHIVETLERVFDPRVGLEQEEQRRAAVLLDKSRHGIRLQLMQCVDEGRQCNLGFFVLSLGHDHAGFAEAVEWVALQGKVRQH